ncbi:hypothetical protein V7x_50510 [Crateriforma conspicua]|uniref:Uncharacterized protein n=1 Tax=Crateriforma conspicua TaxID=2527996 RepID=A0A5C6FSZ5_9PLAN|nr:hypothetical protein [Crateriforma conspicua]TWU63311.1 hypothetical protein V7x_50510 [Crateriforma conspicua]
MNPKRFTAFAARTILFACLWLGIVLHSAVADEANEPADAKTADSQPAATKVEASLQKILQDLVPSLADALLQQFRDALPDLETYAPQIELIESDSVTCWMTYVCQVEIEGDWYVCEDYYTVATGDDCDDCEAAALASCQNIQCDCYEGTAVLTCCTDGTSPCTDVDCTEDEESKDKLKPLQLRWSFDVDGIKHVAVDPVLSMDYALSAIGVDTQLPFKVTRRNAADALTRFKTLAEAHGGIAAGTFRRDIQFSMINRCYLRVASESADGTTVYDEEVQGQHGLSALAFIKAIAAAKDLKATLEDLGRQNVTIRPSVRCEAIQNSDRVRCGDQSVCRATCTATDDTEIVTSRYGRTDELACATAMEAARLLADQHGGTDPDQCESTVITMPGAGKASVGDSKSCTDCQ